MAVELLEAVDESDAVEPELVDWEELPELYVVWVSPALPEVSDGADWLSPEADS